MTPDRLIYEQGVTFGRAEGRARVLAQLRDMVTSYRARGMTGPAVWLEAAEKDLRRDVGGRG